ncbi:hypothetical protein BFR96_10465 [Acinetobacter pittii]|uniref:hypothetical protein n=1 Tax=Acinetobacter pittii TaxID=48296 RepID=UPI000837B476|nr:hypothetical protein [Acinetobacter pittii]OCZ18138.1 hypothetical protein BFR96_10465 [Acinetobacter pittii]
MTDLNKERELCNQSFEKYWDDFCEAYGNGFDRSLAKLFFANAWGEAKAQAVPDTQQKLTDTYYLEGSDYVVDCPFEYDIEIDKGEVLELQKWQRTESTKVYFANIYKDEDNFEILQFASKAEAENAVAENLKFLEASESGAEG